MSLYIEDEETHRLADELARLTGETVTDAITVAIRERLERQREIAERLRRMRAISKRAAKMLRKGGPPVDHGELLYDEDGLPK